MKQQNQKLLNIQKEIQNNFHDLQIRNIQVLDEGIDSRAFLVNRNLVFRFPKHEEVVTQLEVEIRLLPELQKCIDLAIPNFQYVGKQVNGFPFVGYPYIKGKFLKKPLFKKLPPANQAQVLKQIGTFLSQVHSFPIKRAKELNVRTADYKKRLKVMVEWFQKDGKRVLGSQASRYASGVFREHQALSEDFRYTPTLLYADIHPWHVLYNSKKKRIAGIIDFGDVEIGDPDYEFLRIYDNFGLGFIKKLLRVMNYPDPQKVIKKVRWFTKYNMLEDVVIGARRDDKELFAWSIKRLMQAIKKDKTY